jgi:hypothetical protein
MNWEFLDCAGWRSDDTGLARRRARGIPVIEILSATDWRDHKLTTFARVEGKTITYPPEQGSLF